MTYSNSEFKTRIFVASSWNYGPATDFSNARKVFRSFLPFFLPDSRPVFLPSFLLPSILPFFLLHVPFGQKFSFSPFPFQIIQYPVWSKNLQQESGGRRPWREGRGEREKETFNTAFPNETTKRESREKEGGGKKGRRRRKGGKKEFHPLARSSWKTFENSSPLPLILGLSAFCYEQLLLV